MWGYLSGIQFKGVQTERIESRCVGEIETHAAHVQPYFDAFFSPRFSTPSQRCVVICTEFLSWTGIENYPAEGASWSQLKPRKVELKILSAKVGPQDPERWSLWCDAKRYDFPDGGLLDANFD